ncbi:hypothetical protein DXT97_10555 [Agrobacterium tumefaciens]|uniref:hypothetical protein n=1 Tax=Agrobacterium tumefaciens TaxID=358 RepID=UPI00129594E6|nr:hypothetical protein [Agrobacterium tumefaciens]MQB37238.1 hypothetical protein [Agrobacterium tumefaciens]
MIPNIVLDPSFFWLFHHTDTEEEVETLWKVSRPWLQGNMRNAQRVVHGKALERLHDQGLIPAFDDIAKMVERLNLEHVISPHELARVIDRFLSNASSLEEVAVVEDGLFEDKSLQPDEVANIPEGALREHSYDSLLLSALNSCVGQRFCYAFPRLNAGAITMDVGATVAASVAREGIVVPETFNHPLPILRDPEEFRASLNPQTIWDNASDDSEVGFAIALAAERLSGEPLPQLIIGKKFTASLRRNQAIAGLSLSSTTLTKCAQVLVGTPGIAVNQFKYEAVGNKAAKVRKRAKDGAEAYRVHVTSGTVGLRLMLWKLPSGGWEYANVGPKNEEKIEP